MQTKNGQVFQLVVQDVLHKCLQVVRVSKRVFKKAIYVFVLWWRKKKRKDEEMEKRKVVLLGGCEQRVFCC